MPNVSFDGITESTGGFANIEPGAYVLKITQMKDDAAHKFVRVYWDVAEGPFAGTYASSQYPPSTIMGYGDDRAKSYTLHKLHVIADSNGATQDAVEMAFRMDDWKRFIGKKFGAIVRRRLYTAGPNSKTPGADRYDVDVAAWLTPAEIAGGKWNKSLLADKDQRDKSQQPAQQQVTQVPDSFQPGGSTDLYDEDVPF